MRALSILVVSVHMLCACASVSPPSTLEELSKEQALPPLQLSEYIIGPGDVFQIQVWRHPEFNVTAKVGLDGTITYPLIGTISVANMSLTEFRTLLATRLDEYVVNPQISIQVQVPASQKIYVLGEVQKPGMYLLEGPTTALDAIGTAGGFNHDARRNKAVLVRKQADGKVKAAPIDLSGVLKGDEQYQEAYLRRGDVLFVPLSTVALADRFFNHLATAVYPLLTVQSLVINWPLFKDVITTGDFEESPSQIIIPPAPTQ
jgi:polysaccharide export outer membrane protein